MNIIRSDKKRGTKKNNDKTIIKKAELKIYEKTFSKLDSYPSSDSSTISEDLVNDL